MGPINFESEFFVVKKDLGQKRLMGKRNKVKNFVVQIILGPKTLGQKEFWVLNKMCSPKYFGSKNYFGVKQFLSKKILDPNKCLVKKMGIKKILGQNFF